MTQSFKTSKVVEISLGEKKERLAINNEKYSQCVSTFFGTIDGFSKTVEWLSILQDSYISRQVELHDKLTPELRSGVKDSALEAAEVVSGVTSLLARLYEISVEEDRIIFYPEGDLSLVD